MKKSELWFIREELVRTMVGIEEEIKAHIKNSDKRWDWHERRIFKIEQNDKRKKERKSR